MTLCQMNEFNIIVRYLLFVLERNVCDLLSSLSVLFVRKSLNSTVRDS